MASDAILTVSQVMWQLAAWPLIVLLVGALWFRLHAVRELSSPGQRMVAVLPTLAVSLLLASFALLSLGIDNPLVNGTWFIVFPVLAGTYPGGRFVPRWIVAPVAVSVGLGIAYIVTAGAIAEQPWWTASAFATVALLGAQIYRYLRRATSAERESVRWGILGTLLSVESFILLMLLENGQIAGHGPWSVGLANLAGLPLAVGLAIGLLRPRLLGADAALRAVFGFTVAAPILGTAYWFTRSLALSWGAGAEGAALWAAVVVVILVIPVVRLAAWVSDLAVYRGRMSPSTAVALLAERIASEPQADRVPRVFVGTVTDALSGAAARLGGLRESTDEADATAQSETFPVVYQGEELARLWVAPRRGETTLTRRDRDIIQRLALHGAPALHGARTLAELTAAHTRVVLAREEERKSLRRDLHDDLGPALVGLGFAAAAIARLGQTGQATNGVADPAGSIAGMELEIVQLATGLRHDIEAAILQTREISHDLRPAVLDDHGLVDAIRLRIHGQSADELQITVDAPIGRLDLPAAVDLAALRIVQEAVSNVRSHARATRCVVRLGLTGQTLSISISDDGVGLPTLLRPGIGLASIRERAEELGGTVRFGRNEPAGSRVLVELPVGPRAEAGG